jgi:hypothetical protein
MGRWEGPTEGYVLLDALRRAGCTTPFFIFASGGSIPKHVAQALQRGAQGSTSHMDELIAMVNKVLYRRHSA